MKLVTKARPIVFPKPVYVLGTGLSHDGSSCLLKDGVIVSAIEKERLTRKKHDGGSDFETVQYCLDAEGISIDDLALVVQAANFEKDEIQKHQFKGARYFPKDCSVPFVTISHHLAHAYSAAGTTAFDECGILVIDGCGSFHSQCDDLSGAIIPDHVNPAQGLFAEKDSYYTFDGQNVTSVYKDFSSYTHKSSENCAKLPTSDHSIGGLFSMASRYCFGSYDDAGKLMGLAPFGTPGIYAEDLFILENGNVWVDEAVKDLYFDKPADPVQRPFTEHFKYYADIAFWVQAQAEKAIFYVVKERLQSGRQSILAYAGGVALNAVANSKMRQMPELSDLYMEPAAGDNGLAIGCAFYGWMHELGRKKVAHNGQTCFGKIYEADEVLTALQTYGPALNIRKTSRVYADTAEHLKDGKTIAWFQLGSEFGPRALGRRSILADPRRSDIQDHINHTIKFREDFRPFAPAVLYEDRDVYFEMEHESPYMILVDRIREEWRQAMPGVVHVDGTCRVQTVKDKDEPFYKLLEAWKQVSGIPVLLNTSLNKKGMPIVETPKDVIGFFQECALDVLVIGDFIVTKND